MNRATTLATLLLAIALEGRTGTLARERRLLDDFKTVTSWRPMPSDGVELRITPDRGVAGGAMRLDFDFHGGAGYAIARRDIALDLPPNYELEFLVRAEAPDNNFEIKLIDSTGENVWWSNRRGFRFPREWQKLKTKKRQIEFAWGPAGGGEIRRTSALEIVITAGNGGRGTVWIDELALARLPAPGGLAPAPVVSASSSPAQNPPSLAIDGNRATLWRSRGPGEQWFQLDFREPRELGGLIVEWDERHNASSYDVEISDDARRWNRIYRLEQGNGGRDFLFLPETEARYLRLRVRQGAGPYYALREIEIQPLEFSSSRNAFFERIARDAPAGSYPKYFSGKQSYWTVVGVAGDESEALINEEGAIEVDQSGFSLEPFLFVNGTLIGWHDVELQQSLAKGDLPIPTVTWRAGEWLLTITAFASGPPGASVLHARYTIENRSASSSKARLFLAIRPFQVNPPVQFLNVPGGVAEVSSIRFDGTTVRVNENKTIFPAPAPDGFGATPFDGGDITEFLRRGTLPPASAISNDALRATSAALAYDFDLGAGQARAVELAVPFHQTTPAPAQPAAVEREWDELLGRVTIDLPPIAAPLERSLRSNLAYILINLDGAAIQPGSRSYDRSWIRDGALTSAALLRLGHADTVRRFIEWYAPYQFPNGKVPCCVDARGADPVPENDSHGELIYVIAEYFRYTRDRQFLEQMWPHVAGAAAYIDSLRQQRMTEEFRGPSKRVFYGLLPESISHEGYSAKPMHSYWDDFFALKGLEDAAMIAEALGKEERLRFASMRDEFRRGLLESIRLAMEMHEINYIPGSVELGDFDATSTTIAVSPAGEREALEPALSRTFEEYYEFFKTRREGTWVDYTPYEFRVAGTFVRLGQPRRAHELFDFFFSHQRPAGWNHWAEVVGREASKPRFIGDMPHTWVGSDFIRSLTDMLAYEENGSLVIGAGVPPEWLAGEEGGIVIRDLPTHFGMLDLTMRGEGDSVKVTIGGSVEPPKGIVLRAPVGMSIRGARIGGKAAKFSPAGLTVPRAPAVVVLEVSPGPAVP